MVIIPKIKNKKYRVIGRLYKGDLIYVIQQEIYAISQGYVGDILEGVHQAVGKRTTGWKGFWTAGKK